MYRVLPVLLVLAACTAEPSSDQLPTPEEIIVAPSPDGAHPAIRLLYDQGNPDRRSDADPSHGVRRVIIDADCPEIRGVLCGAEVTRAAAIWLSANGDSWGQYPEDAVTQLLINIDLPGTGMGYQMIGAMPASQTLADADLPAILETFQFNGAAENGEIAIADWCGADAGRQTPTFCAAFFEEECWPLKAPEVVEACPASYLERAPR